MSEISFRDVLESLLPDGWKAIGDFDKLLKGIGLSLQEIYELLDSLAYVRDPRGTTLLEDLEKEYGLVKNTSLTEAQRRQNIASVKYAKPDTASWEHLQNKLINAGFTNAVVIPNGPLIDPDLITNGTILANGIYYISQVPAYYKACGSDINYRGHYRAYRGYFLKMNNTEKTYDVGSSSVWWPFVFFIGSAKAGSWPSSPSVTDLDVDANLRAVFETMILKYKPLHSWAILCVNYV